MAVILAAGMNDVLAGVARDRVERDADAGRVGRREGIVAHNNDAHLLAGTKQRAGWPDLDFDGNASPGLSSSSRKCG